MLCDPVPVLCDAVPVLCDAMRGSRPGRTSILLTVLVCEALCSPRSKVFGDSRTPVMGTGF
jgi:hypothetical protein